MNADINPDALWVIVAVIVAVLWLLACLASGAGAMLWDWLDDRDPDEPATKGPITIVIMRVFSLPDAAEAVFYQTCGSVIALFSAFILVEIQVSIPWLLPLIATVIGVLYLARFARRIHKKLNAHLDGHK